MKLLEIKLDWAFVASPVAFQAGDRFLQLTEPFLVEREARQSMVCMIILSKFGVIDIRWSIVGTNLDDLDEPSFKKEVTRHMTSWLVAVTDTES